jgi:hypothetical protein
MAKALCRPKAGRLRKSAYYPTMPYTIPVALTLLTMLPVDAKPVANTVLGVVVEAQCHVTVVSSSTGTNGGTAVFRYWIRTSPAGSGSFVLRDIRAAVSYEVTLPAAGRTSFGQWSAGTVSAKVASFDGGSHSSRAGDIGILRWRLTEAASSDEVSSKVPDLAIECR